MFDDEISIILIYNRLYSFTVDETREIFQVGLVMGEVASFGCRLGRNCISYVLPFSIEVKDSLLLFFSVVGTAWGLFYAEIIGVYQGAGVCLVPL
jgi:hypothetical protein